MAPFTAVFGRIRLCTTTAPVGIPRAAESFPQPLPKCAQEVRYAKKNNIPDLTNHLIHKAIRGMVCSCFTKIGCPQTQRSDKNYCINISILGWSTPHNRANDIFSLCKKYCHFPILFYFSLCSRSFWKTKAWTPHHEFQILLSSSCSLDPSGGQKTVPR